jgi:deazaflavin-dependent oxidoreductase (nitroreductase family)
MNANRTLPANRAPSPDRAPGFVRAPDGLVQWLLRHGAPMGPNGLLTIRGRTTGEPRTAPIAITEVDGRRYVIGAYGNVNWTRNLRAAGEADITLHRKTEHVRATELDPAAAEEFFGVTLHRYIAHFPWFGRVFARMLFGVVGPEVLNDPAKAAATRPVFELTTTASR